MRHTSILWMVYVVVFAYHAFPAAHTPVQYLFAAMMVVTQASLLSLPLLLLELLLKPGIRANPATGSSIGRSSRGGDRRQSRVRAAGRILIIRGYPLAGKLAPPTPRLMCAAVSVHSLTPVERVLRRSGTLDSFPQARVRARSKKIQGKRPCGRASQVLK